MNPRVLDLEIYYSNPEFEAFFASHGIPVTEASIDHLTWERQFRLAGKLRGLPMDLPAEECLRLVRWDLQQITRSLQNYYNIAFAERYAPHPPPPTLTIVPRIVVVVEGGVVTQVLSDTPVDVCELDYDTEEAEPDHPNLVQVPQIDGTNEGHTTPAFLFTYHTLHDPGCIHRVFNLKR